MNYILAWYYNLIEFKIFQFDSVSLDLYERVFPIVEYEKHKKIKQSKWLKWIKQSNSKISRILLFSIKYFVCDFLYTVIVKFSWGDRMHIYSFMNFEYLNTKHYIYFLNFIHFTWCTYPECRFSLLYHHKYTKCERKVVRRLSIFRNAFWKMRDSLITGVKISM